MKVSCRNQGLQTKSEFYTASRNDNATQDNFKRLGGQKTNKPVTLATSLTPGLAWARRSLQAEVIFSTLTAGSCSRITTE